MTDITAQESESNVTKFLNEVNLEVEVKYLAKSVYVIDFVLERVKELLEDSCVNKWHKLPYKMKIIKYISHFQNRTTKSFEI